MSQPSTSLAAATSLVDIVQGNSWFIIVPIFALFALIAITVVFSWEAGKSALFAIALTVCTGGLLWMTMMDSEKKTEKKEWMAKHCKVVEKREGSSSLGAGVSLSGQVGLFSSGESPQTKYDCDDGVSYWINN